MVSEGVESEGCNEARGIRGEEHGAISFCLELYYNNGELTVN
jgi:hypothetical protein